MAKRSSSGSTMTLGKRPAIAFTKAAAKGEGSRGGKILGHTKSGKPIYFASPRATSPPSTSWSPASRYAREGKQIDAGHYHDWSVADHLDAANAHNEATKAHYAGRAALNTEALAKDAKLPEGERLASSIKAEQLVRHHLGPSAMKRRGDHMRAILGHDAEAAFHRRQAERKGARASIEDIRGTYEDPNTDDEEARPSLNFQALPGHLLSRIARGEIDPVRHARAALAERGHDTDGNWVGFDKARAHHHEAVAAHTAFGPDGKKRRVSVPPKED